MKLCIQASEYRKYFLNDYVDQSPSLRIELQRGGNRCLWAARTTKVKMEDTKRYLLRTWKRES